MEERAELVARLLTIAAALPGEEPISHRACDAARRVLEVDGVSVTLESAEGTRVTLHATDETAARIERLQDSLGTGPAAEALRAHEPVVVDLAPGSDRTQVFAEATTRRTSAGQVAAAPMRVRGETVGVLTLYRTDPDRAFDLAAVGVVADALGVLVVNDTAGAAQLSDTAWSERAQIHQAVGMVVAQLAVCVPDALAILRAHAFAMDADLLEVARSVLDRSLVFTRDEEA
jgi:GAF domain-containing protein